MKELTALNILKRARTKIADPKDWGQGMRQSRDNFNSCCAAEAIEESCPYAPEAALKERRRAIRAIYHAAGLDWENGVVLTKWNDAPGRAHADVMVAFNLAIATLRLS